MRFEWDESKDLLNRAKHGVSFEIAKLVFDDDYHLTVFNGFIRGEERWQTIGLVNGVVTLLVVHTYRITNGEEIIRIISARKATATERTGYGRV